MLILMKANQSMLNTKRQKVIVAVIKSLRLPFLILTPVNAFLAYSVVVSSGSPINLIWMSLALLGALMAHISVNTFNEFFDFDSGLDLKTNKTPFSGGSGGLPQVPDAKNTVLMVAIISFLITVFIGVYFIVEHGLGILPIGLLGLLLITLYTRQLNRYPWLCLMAPGLGFGFLFVVGIQFALVGEYQLLAWYVAIVPFCLSTNLLLLNQYPDIDADITVGRRHFPIAYGVKRSNGLYAFFMVLPIVVVISYVLVGLLPLTSLYSLLVVPLSFFAWLGAIKYGKDIGQHSQYLASNVAVAILMPIILAASIIY